MANDAKKTNHMKSDSIYQSLFADNTDISESHVAGERNKVTDVFLERQAAELTYLLEEANNKLAVLNKRIDDAIKLHDAVLESSPEIIIFALDRNCCYLTFNSRHRAEMRKKWGKEIEIGMNMLDVTGSHCDSDSLKANIDRALSGESFTKTEEIKDENLSRLCWQGFWSPILSDDGKVTGLTCFAQNVTERGKAEKELREKQDYLENLINFANAPIIVWDSQLRITRFNHAFENLSGRTEAEVLGQNVDILFPSEKQCHFTELVKKTQKGHRWESVEIDIEHIDKSINTILWNSASIYADDGATIAATIAQGHNITVRKKNEAALRESERQFRHAVDEAPVPIMLYAEDGNIIKINRTWTNITGYAQDEIPTMDIWSQKTSSAGKQDLKTSVQEIFEQSQRHSEGEYSVHTKDGQVKQWDFYSANIGKLENGRRMAMSIGIDVTERRKLEAALAQEKKLLETTMISVGDGVISTNADGSVVFMNRIAERLTGYTREDAKGKPIDSIFNLVNEFTHQKCASIIKKVLTTGKIQHTEEHAILISKQGIERPVEDSAAPIVQENGDIVGAALVFRDYTDKRQKHDEIIYLSYHDQLTGLYNRRFYEEELIRLDTQRTFPIALIMVDVNGLKLTNDAFGHQAGDQILQKVSRILRKACRHEEIISRIGGDEFVILLPRVDQEEASAIIERINTALSNESVQNGILSISAGFAVKTNVDEDISLVYKKAEDEMYRHKLTVSSEIRKKTVDMIMNSLLDKDEAEMLHSKRVSGICESIAVALNLNEEAVSQIKTAGLMHDVGKIGISESILNKTEELDESEWSDIKRHSEIGYRILSSAKEFTEISEYILALHERWDGTGYPKGLAGQEIPVEARIIALAEAYDVMTSQNIYSRGKTKEEAINEIRSCSGTQFDPEIAEIFIGDILKHPPM